MTKNDLAKALDQIRPCNVHVSDGRVIYVDNPEVTLLSDTVLVVGQHVQGRVVKDIAIIALPHITGVECAKARPLRKVA